MATITRSNIAIAAASNGRAAVAACVSRDGSFGGPWKYAGKGADGQSIGAGDNREEFRSLLVRAAEKLGYEPDRRCRDGWRRMR